MRVHIYKLIVITIDDVESDLVTHALDDALGSDGFCNTIRCLYNADFKLLSVENVEYPDVPTDVSDNEIDKLCDDWCDRANKEIKMHLE